MKKLLLTLALLSLFAFTLRAEVSTAQTPPVTATFTCNLSAPKCTEFLRLVSTGMGWTAESPLTRQQFVQRAVVNHLIRIGRQQQVFEASEAAKASSEATYNADFPDQP